ncbi:glycine cleavage system protein H [Hydrogenobaculum acidophilum]
MEDLGKDEVVVGRYIVKTQKYYYSKDHVWVLVKGNIARVGITDYAQFQVDTIEEVKLPSISDYLEPQDVICRIEGLKGMFEVLSPITGTVENTNSYVEDNPTIVNEDPYEEGWLVEVRMSDPLEIEDLMSPDDYIEYLEEIIRDETGSIGIIHSPDILEEEPLEDIPEDELGYEEER